MARTRPTSPTKFPRRKRRPDRKRVTIELSRTMLKRLAHAAVDAELDYGVVVEDALKYWLGGSRYVDTSIGTPERPELRAVGGSSPSVGDRSEVA